MKVCFYASDRNFDALQETALIRARLSLFCIPVLTVIFIMCKRIITVAGCLNLMLPKLTAVPGCVMRSLNFLTVVAKDYTLKADGAQVLFQQGARLQLADKKASAYTVKVPVRTKEGKLQEEKVVLLPMLRCTKVICLIRLIILSAALLNFTILYTVGADCSKASIVPVLSVMLTVQ